MIINPKVQEALLTIKAQNELHYYLACQVVESITTGFSMNSSVFKEEIRKIIPNIHMHLTQMRIIQLDMETRTYEMVVPLFINPNDTLLPLKNGVNAKNVKSIVKNGIDDYIAAFCKEVKVLSNGKKRFYGLRGGSQGDKAAAIKKLIKWFKDTNYEYTMDDVIKTAQVYAQSCSEDHYKYLQASDYFIMKDGRSRLSSFIDEFKDKKVGDSQIGMHNELV